MRTPCYETLTLIFSLGLIRARRYPRLASKESGSRWSGFGPPRRDDMSNYIYLQCSPLPLRYRRDLRQVLGFGCQVSATEVDPLGRSRS